MTRAWVAGVLLALTPAGVGASGERGFVELRLHGYSGVEGQPVQTIQRFRPELSTDLSDRLSLTVGVELGLSQGRSFQNEWQETLRASALGPVLEAAQCTWPEEENSFLRVSRAEDYLSVERLYVDWYLPGADLRLGRQAVHWGSAMVVNPTDPFPEILVLQPWRQRRGVNALRATLPIGEDHDVQMVLGGNDALDAARIAVRGRLNVGLADISLVGAYRQESESGIVGLDLRGTALVGYWLEGSAHFDDHGEWFEEVAVGIDYGGDRRPPDPFLPDEELRPGPGRRGRPLSGASPGEGHQAAPEGRQPLALHASGRAGPEDIGPHAAPGHDGLRHVLRGHCWRPPTSRRGTRQRSSARKRPPVGPAGSSRPGPATTPSRTRGG